VEKYSDLITNGLDLLSFLLVTPEILRAIAPTLGEFLGTAIGGILVTMILLPLAFMGGLLRGDHWWPVVAAMLICAMSSWSLNRVFSFRERSNIIHEFTHRASKHFLAVGVVLFLISRLIAFYSSVVKADLR
jgi:hypothetical protein